VIEGKQIQPFVVDLSSCRFHIAARTAATLLDPARTFARDRLAYRDVAAAGNRRTLIAAIVPARVLTTHTLFCVREALSDDVQQFLCGVFNSFVANYLVRLRVSTHVNVSIIERLPVPKPSRDSAVFRQIGGLSVRLAAAPGDLAAAARLEAAAARLYALSVAQFGHVLATFPLVPPEDRARAAEAFAAHDS
jgi:hypothetical protein